MPAHVLPDLMIRVLQMRYEQPQRQIVYCKFQLSEQRLCDTDALPQSPGGKDSIVVYTYLSNIWVAQMHYDRDPEAKDLF